jgi:hypothetical protein
LSGSWQQSTEAIFRGCQQKIGINVEKNVICGEKDGIRRGRKVLGSRKKSSGYGNESAGFDLIVSDR